MRKFVATACLALLLIGCDSAFREEGSYQGRTTSQWIALLQDKDADISARREATLALGELGLSETDQTVPALRDALDQEGDLDIRLCALKSLEKLAPKARKAQAAVGRVLNDPHAKTVFKQALKTYRAIELNRPSALNNNT